MVRTLDAPEWLVHVCWYGALSVGGGVGCCLLGAVGTFTADCCRAPTVGRAVAGSVQAAQLAPEVVNDPWLSVMGSAFVDHSVADRTGGDKATAVRWWRKWCVARGISVDQSVGMFEPVARKRAVERLLIDFSVWLKLVRGVNSETARKYVRKVVRWHSLRYGELTPGYEMLALEAALTGMWKTFPPPPKRLRRGFRTQQLAEAVSSVVGGSSPADLNDAACAEVSFCGLLRGVEAAGAPEGRAWSAETGLSRGDLSFREVMVDSVAVEEAVIRVRPCKKPNMRAGKTVEVVLRDGVYLRPVTRLRALVEGDPTQGDPRATPLFRQASGASFTTRYIRRMVKALARAVGEDPRQYGAQSLRIGGASAALAAHVPANVIRALGRWDSDVYEVYTRASREAALRFGSVVASTAYTDFEGEFADEEFVIRRGFRRR